MQSVQNTNSFGSTERQSPVTLKKEKEVSPKSPYRELNAKVILSQILNKHQSFTTKSNSERKMSYQDKTNIPKNL